MAVLTKEQVEFVLEESLKVRMENEELKRTRERDLKEAYDKGYDEGHKTARTLMKG